MTRQPIHSSAIASVGYDPEAQVMEIEFRGGRVYSYQAVPPEAHAALIAAPSVGKHFALHVQGKFSTATATAHDQPPRAAP